MGDENATIAAVARVLGRARSVVVLTGAGVSAESGIPTFRDTMEGLWASFDPQKLATPEAFEADPEMVTRWYDHRRRGCAACEPNAGHVALADMERSVVSRGGRFTLLTQNVDRLHQRAGSQAVVELHGTIMVWRCTKTGREYPDLPMPFPEYPPRSDAGGLLRPAVVWFGEMLPEAALRAADEALAGCDLFFSIGTSSVVYPAAGFVQVANANGATTAEINRDATPASHVVDWSIRAKSGVVLPRIVKAAFGDA
jgi:NAD-dependent deacetylase